jgi:hypothetical protein
MAFSVQIEGLEGVIKALARLKASVGPDAQVEGAIGYDAPYAGRVHEDLEMVHPNGGQAKFLEEPARLFEEQMVGMVITAVQEGRGLRAGVREALEFLKAESQKLVPVRTGVLRDSAYVEVS